MPNCGFCEQEVGGEEDLCHGCGEYICQDMTCEGNKNQNMPFGGHDAELPTEDNDEDWD